MRRRRSGFAPWGLGAVCSVVVAAGYWFLCSSYSQLLGWFPFRSVRPARQAEVGGTRAATVAGGEVTSPKLIALTFDDGPNEPFTSEIADFLHERQAVGTFFQVGRCVNRFPDVSAALVQQGHVIGNHSWSHTVSRCVRPQAQRTETTATQEILSRAIGRTPMLYRPPWLLRTPTLFRVLQAQQLQAISGEFAHALEVFQPSARRMADRALAKAEPGAILIFHDGFDSRGGDRTRTVAATKLVVTELLDRGFRLVGVDQLLGIPAYRQTAEDG